MTEKKTAKSWWVPLGLVAFVAGFVIVALWMGRGGDILSPITSVVDRLGSSERVIVGDGRFGCGSRGTYAEIRWGEPVTAAQLFRSGCTMFTAGERVVITKSRRPLVRVRRSSGDGFEYWTHRANVER